MAIDFANKEKSYERFDAAKRRGTWDPMDIDLSDDAEQWESVFTQEQKDGIMGTFVAFYEGEESVTKTLTPYLTAVDALEDAPFDTVQQEMFLTTQMFEEAKHTDFFSRYFDEVFGTQRTDVDDYEESELWRNPELRRFLIDDLYAVGDELREAARRGDQHHLRRKLGEAYMHYMGLVEGQLALSGYEVFDEALKDVGDKAGVEVLPGFQEGVRLIREDEGRHIANGRWVMKKLADEDPEIVPEVYEPKIQDYVERIFGRDVEQDGAYDVDFQGLIEETVNERIQETIGVIGEDRFERFDGSTRIDTDAGTIA